MGSSQDQSKYISIKPVEGLSTSEKMSEFRKNIFISAHTIVVISKLKQWLPFVYFQWLFAFRTSIIGSSVDIIATRYVYPIPYRKSVEFIV